MTRPAAMAFAGCAALAVLWRGGLRSDVWSNRLQIVLMYGGFAAILPAALRAFPPGGLAAALPAGHLSWTGAMSPARLIAWWLIAVWTLVDPSFHQRCAAARDPRVARLGILTSICFWAAFDLMTTTAGLYARALEPGLSDPLMAFPALADRLLGPAARGIFYAGLAASITAALQGKALQAAVALGKDAAGRAARASEERQEAWTRWGIIAALAFSWLFAWLLPSVVGLWYALGSAAIPGLLLPLLGVYWPALRRSPTRALAASLGGFSASLAWLALGAWNGGPPLGVEPMFPGLALSAALWFSARP
jgi:SSS family solute:Na+ symporter